MAFHSGKFGHVHNTSNARVLGGGTSCVQGEVQVGQRKMEGWDTKFMPAGPWLSTHSQKVTHCCYHLDVCWPKLMN